MPEWLKIMPKPIQWVVGLLLAFTTLWLPAAKFSSLWPFLSGEIRITTYQKIQYDMTMRHLSEQPSKEFVLEDDALGATKVRLYDSDRAVLLVRAAPGALTSVTWMPKPAPAPEAVADSGFLQSPAYALTDRSDVAFGTEFLTDALYASVIPAGCIPFASHGQPSSQREDPPRVWLSWPDTCEGFLYRNPDGSIASDSEGQPIFVWTKCVH